MTRDQLALFDAAPAMPEGFSYRPDVLTRDEEAALLREVRELVFKPFEFQGYVGKRRVVHFGWKYDYDARVVREADAIPPFLLGVRDVAADFAGLPAEHLQQVLVTEYEPGAAIGWHRDKAVFGEVIGISLLSACTFRLRRAAGDAWERASIVAAPRSAYVMRGPSRTEWEHSIPAVDALRYSITFRNFKPAY